MIFSPGVSDSNQGEENCFFLQKFESQFWPSWILLCRNQPADDSFNFSSVFGGRNGEYCSSFSFMFCFDLFCLCVGAVTAPLLNFSRNLYKTGYSSVQCHTKNLPRISLLKGKIKQQAEAELGQAQKSGTERC